ncbi:hypothetical protein SAMN05443637_12041 [Pseudonocardia thermophila]|jgi:hypothetical protein|uniref:Uncharacterized protein n=1 Tax=Pseudonocardia thermophila TaxID=1848 RepID=A0A1M6YIZ8_PSETH|nr:hypothetical protein [Pseudonocardia thermophila]SHL18113.1 hypothetical protein SAMN05443637_12041 [Pseudonocardia thermophila]
MSTTLDRPLTRAAWMQYALMRIRELVDKPRSEMTDAELAVYTLANNALTGGDPVVPLADGENASRMCRVCGERWGLKSPAAHHLGCPVTA